MQPVCCYCSTTFSHIFFVLQCRRLYYKRRLIWFEYLPMSTWHQSRSAGQLQNRKQLVRNSAHCCYRRNLLFGCTEALPCPSGDIAIHTDRIGNKLRQVSLLTDWNTWDTRNGVKSPRSYLLWGVLLFTWTNSMCAASWADTQKGLHWQLKIHRFASLCNASFKWSRSVYLMLMDRKHKQARIWAGMTRNQWL